jgi:hypothetical protein
MSRPNLFAYAPSELSQDAFLCWLLEWADPRHEAEDAGLHAGGKELIRLAFEKHGNSTAPALRSIEVHAQWKRIDILVRINETHVLLIEDKVFTREHSDQLKRYLETVRSEFPDCEVLPIYLQTGNQPDYNAVESAGYQVLNRSDLLKIIGLATESGSENAILRDFDRHLRGIEDRVLAYQNEPPEKWDRLAWEGFFMEVQSHLGDGGWGHVPNAAGGFMGFWWCWRPVDGGHLYLQLQNQVEGSLDLCFKLERAEKTDRWQAASDWSTRVLDRAAAHGIEANRPSRLRSGDTMTIALWPDYLARGADGTVDFLGTVENLRRAEHTIMAAVG